jgi:hypothetical protein
VVVPSISRRRALTGFVKGVNTIRVSRSVKADGLRLQRLPFTKIK